MRFTPPSLAIAVVGLGVSVFTATQAHAYGEEVGGFPSWAERVELQLTNRARVDPETDLAKCAGGNCPDSKCYKPIEPLYHNEQLARAARFHSSEMVLRKFFAHDSNCTLVKTLKDSFPSSCLGEATCACAGGVATGSTSFGARVGIWSGGASGEIIASPSEPNSAFYLWLHEKTTDPTCKFSSANGHRWLLLTAKGGVGFGVNKTGNSTGDFGPTAGTLKIASGTHYPRSGASVEMWASFSDKAGPTSALVNIAGTCQPMTLGRGTPTNGAYTAKVAATGCQRYYFQFTDSTGAQITYPSTGSLGLGDDKCADFETTRPAAGAGCSCKAVCTGKTCGDDGCGGSCGTCKTGESCGSAGSCVALPPDAGPPTDAGLTDSGTTDTGTTIVDTGTISGDSGSSTDDSAVGDGAIGDAVAGDAVAGDAVGGDAGEGGTATEGDTANEGGCNTSGASSRGTHYLAGLTALLGLGLLTRRRAKRAC